MRRFNEKQRRTAVVGNWVALVWAVSLGLAFGLPRSPLSHQCAGLAMACLAAFLVDIVFFVYFDDRS